MDSDVSFSDSDVSFSTDGRDELNWMRWPHEADDDEHSTEHPESIPQVKGDKEPPLEDFSIIFKGEVLEICEMLGRGGYGQVYSSKYGNLEVAVKFAKIEDNKESAVKSEYDLYKELQEGTGVTGLPFVYGHVSDFIEERKLLDNHQDDANQRELQEGNGASAGNYDFMIMQKLERKLLDKHHDDVNQRRAPADIANIAIEAIKILKNLHNKGYVHADVKPGNFMYGKEDGKEDGKEKLFLIDLNLAVKWRDKEKHVEYDQRPYCFRGTSTFASVHAHLGRTAKNGSRRDDLQSLAYTLLYLRHGCLPWQKNTKADNEKEEEKMLRNFQICQEKMSYSPRKLSLLWPKESRTYFKKFLDNVMNLKFDDDPPYEEYISWFGSIKNGSQGMPSTSPQINGATSPRWISIYNHQRAMKQRYHYNVSQNDKVLSRYIDKESRDKIFISCACSSENLLALIKREGTGYTDQVYSILDNLDDRSWIEGKWSQNYCITTLAGTNEGKLLVVMAKGTRFSNQLIGKSEYFPETFLKQNWDNVRIITAMTTAGNNWVVVLSQCTGSSQTIEQAIEFDLCYPMEGIYNRWRRGYRISLAAASENQIAFVLDHIVEDGVHAKDGRSVAKEPQKMLLTKAFPGSRIKKNWSKCYYVSSLCYCPRRSYLG